MRAGLMAAVYVNMHRDPKKSKAVEWEDFFPDPFVNESDKLVAKLERFRAYLAALN